MKIFTALSIALSASCVLARPVDTDRPIEPVDWVESANHDEVRAHIPFFWTTDSEDSQLSKRLQYLEFWWKPEHEETEGESGEAVEKRESSRVVEFWWNNAKEEKDGEEEQTIG